MRQTKTAASRPPFQRSIREFGGADRDRTDDLLNAIQALSQLSYSPTKCNVPNALSRPKFLLRTPGRGAFYGSAVRCRNAASETEIRVATLRERRVFALAFPADPDAAALGAERRRRPSQAAGREAGTGRRR